MTEQNYQAMRRAMVESQLRTTGVNDARVLAAMAAVPREAFVPAERKAIAYADAAVRGATGEPSNRRWRWACCSPKPGWPAMNARS